MNSCRNCLPENHFVPLSGTEVSRLLHLWGLQWFSDTHGYTSESLADPPVFRAPIMENPMLRKCKFRA